MSKHAKSKPAQMEVVEESNFVKAVAPKPLLKSRNELPCADSKGLIALRKCYAIRSTNFTTRSFSDIRNNGHFFPFLEIGGTVSCRIMLHMETAEPAAVQGIANGRNAFLRHLLCVRNVSHFLEFGPSLSGLLLLPRLYPCV